MENHTAKHFVLQLGSLASLYLSLSFLLVLLFGIINLMYPDQAEGFYAVEGAASSVRLGIAMVLVFFPTYLLLTRRVNALRRQEATSTYLTLTKWLIYLSLLIGGAVLLGDLAAVIMGFLEGELTTRFILKALAVLIVVGSAFYYYLLDAQGYWIKNEQLSKMYGMGAGLLALLIVGYGFMYIETPTEVREGNLDGKQVQDLVDIQSRIEGFIITNERLPENLNELPKIGALPGAPAGRAAYRYAKTDKGFQLCAQFAERSKPMEFNGPGAFEDGALIKNAWVWEHEAGDYCFDRVVGNMTAPAPLR